MGGVVEWVQREHRLSRKFNRVAASEPSCFRAGVHAEVGGTTEFLPTDGMNDLFFVRYQAKLMLLDSMDMPKDVELAHRRLSDFVWTMDGPPRDDNVTLLVEICRTTLSDWARLRGELELKGWHSDGKGHFTHDKVVSTLLESREFHEKRCNQTKAATESRKKRNVERNDDVTLNVTSVQSQSQSHSNKQTKNSHPTLKEVLDAASMTGMLPEDATHFWHHFEASGWIDGNGNPILSWRSKMQTWKTESRAKDFKLKMPTTKARDAVASILKGVA